MAGIDPSLLYVTVHTSDDEAQRLWETETGIAPGRISRFDEDNFWTMGPTGPCGPCTEISGHRRANASGPGDTGPNLGTRYLEVWNLVFQQYNRGADGVMTELPRKAIDTGAASSACSPSPTAWRRCTRPTCSPISSPRSRRPAAR